ncbi:MAG TPA: bifunctional 5,10-methylenetetrahydrofolate dehydrogenase/5,10-methenyltetrahydrofolate cyclohydrolase [Firmicutes bacterium]|nr:bifunctional 5,10-methylenetetrahydrofolate dehydrogenase/5,10-methenyltetrahydrofolate cyclohydrolase [Bacillota bacterium]
MKAKILSGKEVVARLREDLASRVEELGKRGIRPLLSMVVVGDAAPAQAYIRGIEKACEAVGVTARTGYFPPAIGQEEVEEHLAALNQDPAVHGVILMQPLPPHLEEGRLAALLRPEKDVDCFTPGNAGRVMAGDSLAFPPATPQAVLEILKYYDIPLEGRQAVVIGRSMVVGKPLAMLLLKENATVTICHTRTRDLAALCRQADLVVAAAGRPGLVTGEMIKPGAGVVDVGINFVDGKMVGDVDFEGVSSVAGAVTPVPGGVGTVTSTVIVKHVVLAAERAASS